MISRCFEVVGALGWGDGIEQNADFLPERLDGAVGGLFEQRLEFGEELFDGVEVGGIRRQQAQGRAPGLNRLLHAGHFMAGQVVGDGDVAGLQRRHKHCRTYRKNAWPSMGPSRTSGAVISFTRRPAMKVVVPRQLFLPIATIIFAGCRQG